jgi:hypothetical protein
MTDDRNTLLSVAQALEVVVAQHTDATMLSPVRAAADLLLALEAAGFRIAHDLSGFGPLPVIHPEEVSRAVH